MHVLTVAVSARSHMGVQPPSSRRRTPICPRSSNGSKMGVRSPCPALVRGALFPAFVSGIAGQRRPTTSAPTELGTLTFPT